jgi:hypothetical protein
MSVTYTLPVSDHTVLFVSGLLHAERQRLGTRAGTRSLGCYRQAIPVLRWLLDGTRIAQLAADNTLSRSTGYTYLHEGLTVIAAHTTGLHSALLAAKMAGYSHVTIDGTLIETDPCRTPGPTPGVDLWWSGKHDNHGGNVQVITAPDGWPLWTSPVRPGREHDTTALRSHNILPLLTAWTDDHLRVLGDLGYEGEVHQRDHRRGPRDSAHRTPPHHLSNRHPTSTAVTRKALVVCGDGRWLAGAVWRWGPACW